MSTHNICFCGENQGASNEYPQHMFSWRNKKNINTFGLKKSALTRAKINLTAQCGKYMYYLGFFILTGTQTVILSS